MRTDLTDKKSLTTRRRVAVLSVLLLCASCARPDSPPTALTPSPPPARRATAVPSPTPRPKRVTVCLPNEPDSLYYYGTQDLAARHIWHALYDGPVDTPDYRQEPVILDGLPRLGDSVAIETISVQSGDRVLAASGSVMELAPGVSVRDNMGQRTTFRGEPIAMERMVVTFTLRSDVQWSDGTPLTPDDSVFSFELAADSGTPADKYLIQRTADYQATRNDQLVWRGVPGYIDSSYALSFWHPLPRHAWGELSAAELYTSEVSTRRPLGWGPFAIRDWETGSSLTLERNPYYFRAGQGLPRVDEVIFRFISDTETLADQLLAGACDIVTHEGMNSAQVVQLQAATDVFAIVSADSSWELLAFGITPVHDYTRPDLFEDVRVRRAVAQCVDRQALANEIVPETGRVLHSYLPPEHPAYAQDALTAWPYDPEAGALLLGQAGWYDEDGDGIREAHAIPGVADWTPFQVTYSVPDNPHRLRIAKMIETQLKSCGIDVVVETDPPEVLFAPGPEGKLFGRRIDLAQFSWQFTLDPLCEAYLSSQIPGPGRWQQPNVAGFIDDEYDQACRAALKTLPGSTDYAMQHALPQRIFSERLPVLPLFQHQRTTWARTTIRGLSPTSSEASKLWNIEEIDIQR